MHALQVLNAYHSEISIQFLIEICNEYWASIKIVTLNKIQPSNLAILSHSQISSYLVYRCTFAPSTMNTHFTCFESTGSVFCVFFFNSFILHDYLVILFCERILSHFNVKWSHLQFHWIHLHVLVFRRQFWEKI